MIRKTFSYRQNFLVEVCSTLHIHILIADIIVTAAMNSILPVSFKRSIHLLPHAILYLFKISNRYDVNSRLRTLFCYVNGPIQLKLIFLLLENSRGMIKLVKSNFALNRSVLLRERNARISHVVVNDKVQVSDTDNCN